MPNVLSLIGSAWRFYRKHPALNNVALWMLFLPLTATNIFLRLLEPEGFSPTSPFKGTLPPTGTILLLSLLLLLLFGVIMVWGDACVLVVGRRMIQHQAGRPTTSFRALRRQGGRLIFPLLLTKILRACIVFLWSLLAIVPLIAFLTFANTTMFVWPVAPLAILPLGSLLLLPAIMYSLRTAFYDTVLVAEKKYYRAALRRSAAVVKGQTWSALWYLLALGILLYVPINIVTSLLERGLYLLDRRLLPIGDILDGGLTSIATILFTLSSILLFGALRDRHDHRPIEIKPEI